jgi:anti-sigma B factor antagonist
MLPKALRASIRQRSNLAVIELHGEVDGFGHDVLNDAYAKAEGWGLPAILLNFGDVGYINSKGIALIVGLLSRARASSTRLLACGLSEHYLEIFQITRLSDYITIYPDEKTALLEAASLREPVHARQENDAQEAL